MHNMTLCTQNYPYIYTHTWVYIPTVLYEKEGHQRVQGNLTFFVFTFEFFKTMSMYYNCNQKQNYFCCGKKENVMVS